MPYDLLISTETLYQNMHNPDWVILDCRFSLDDPEWGRRAYQLAHIPGALYAHLNEDLSGPIVPGKTGRHPLPELAVFARTLSRWGVDDSVQVVVYDDTSAAFTAYRLWWMVRWLGHAAVAVLDGGIQRWQKEGYLLSTGSRPRPAREFVARPHPEMIASMQDVEKAALNPGYRLLDGRSLAIFSAEEPPKYDPINGHIPGAVSAPSAENYDASNEFKPASVLKARFEQLLAGVPVDKVISYCGSGVRGAQNIFAMRYAGLEGEARLYPGSWSEWITDPGHAVATGK